MEKEQRVEWIDVAKGIGLLLVIMGHTMTTPIREASDFAHGIYTAIYFFHMPFMFYLSGRTFGMSMNRYVKGKNSVILEKKAKQLLVPYLVYGTVVYLVFFMANQVSSLEHILSGAGYGKQAITEWLYGVVIGDNLYAYHLWYIYGLFLMTVFSYILCKYCKYHKWIMLAAGVVALVARIYVDTTYWGILNLVMKCYVWFVVGICVDFSKYVGKIWAIIWQFASLVYVCIIGMNWNNWNTHSGCVEYEVIKWIADVGLLMLCTHLAMLSKHVIKKFFTYTGQNSFGIYLFHQPFFASGAGMVLYKVLGLPLPLAIVMTFAMCYLCPILVLKLLDLEYLNKLKPFLLGTTGKKRE